MSPQRFWQDDADPTKRMDVISDNLPANATTVLDFGNQSSTLLPQGIFVSPIRGATFPTANADRVGQLFYSDSHGLLKALDTAGNWQQVDHVQSYLSVGSEAASMTTPNLPVKSTYGDLAVRAVISAIDGRYLWSRFSDSSAVVTVPTDPNQKTVTRFQKASNLTTNSATMKSGSELVVGDLAFAIDYSSSGPHYYPSVRSTTGADVPCEIYGFEMGLGTGVVDENGYRAATAITVAGLNFTNSYIDLAAIEASIYTASHLYEIKAARLLFGANDKYVITVDRSPL